MFNEAYDDYALMVGFDGVDAAYVTGLQREMRIFPSLDPRWRSHRAASLLRQRLNLT